MTPAALAALHAAAFADARPWSEAEFAALLAAPGALLLAEPDSFLLGRAVAGEAEVLTLATRPEARRRGLARALLRGFHAAAHRAGAERALLEVAEDNAPALALYAAEGWSPVGRRPAYYARPGAAPVAARVLARALP